MRKSVVVYFSRTGYTRGVAEAIARRLDAQLLPISEAGSRAGVWGYLRSVIEALRRTGSSIVHPPFQSSQHPLVVIGTPVWAGRLSSPIRTFVIGHQWSSCRLAFFCTMGGRGAEAVFEELQGIAGREPVATLALTDSDIDGHRIDERLDQFCAKLTGVRQGADTKSRSSHAPA